MAAASGIPGIVTTPIPPEGPASSLTAMGPLERTTIGSKPTFWSGAPETDPVVPPGTVAVLMARSPDDVTAYTV
jgi:hypothetical protein